MKAHIIGLVLLAAAPLVSAEWVNGYIRADGTYVAGYYRSAPNNTVIDNYSTKGNTNPYTGQPGYVNPYQQPKPYVYKPPQQYQPVENYQPYTYTPAPNPYVYQPYQPRKSGY